VANFFTAARENCETLGDVARLARRKVASVMKPTISPTAVKQALVEAGGSVTGAARTLGIASASLRRLVRVQPVLADVVFEQIEREIDAAQQVLWDGLDSDNVMTRIRAGRTSCAIPRLGGVAAGECARGHLVKLLSLRTSNGSTQKWAPALYIWAKIKISSLAVKSGFVSMVLALRSTKSGGI
jgi:hypothetical protein